MNTPTSSPPSPDKSTFKSNTALKDCIAGVLSGSLAKTAVAPIERVKLLMQLQFSLDRVNGSLEERVSSRTSAWEVVNTVYREEGLLSFWRGEKIVIAIIKRFIWQPFVIAYFHFSSRLQPLI